MQNLYGPNWIKHCRRWCGMMERCYDPDCKAYKNYGGRGISVHERWHDPRVYIAELPGGYRPKLELDRIDNDGNYEPGNVRWATRQQNCANRRTARIITFDGESKSLTEWSHATGLPRSVIANRIDELGWSLKRALSEPIADRMENIRRVQVLRWGDHLKKPRPKPLVVKRFSYRGREMTIRELSQETGLSIALLRKRLCERGWSIEKATRDAG